MKGGPPFGGMTAWEREMLRLQSELVKWVKVTSYQAAKDALMGALDTDKKKIVYHLSHGEAGTQDIQALTGVNVRFVSEWWRAWEKIGIMEETSEVRGRRRKLFELEDFGIEVPVLPSEASLEGGSGSRGG